MIRSIVALADKDTFDIEAITVALVIAVLVVQGVFPHLPIELAALCFLTYFMLTKR